MLFAISVFLNLHLRHSKSEVYKHSNLNFAHHFVIYWLFQNGANKNQHQDLYQRETVCDKFVFFFSKLVRQKNSVRWDKYAYVCEWDMCWRNFCNFPWWLKNVKSRSKIAIFFKWAPSWNLISQKVRGLQTFQLKFCSSFCYLLIVSKWRE